MNRLMGLFRSIAEALGFRRPKVTSINIPDQATVLTLLGMNFDLYNYMPHQLKGIFRRSPYTLHKVEYPASITPDSIPTGVANLNSDLRSTVGPKIVLAHSQGAQVATRWMAEYANDPTAPRDITFILTGNPLRNPTGLLIGKRRGGVITRPTSLTTPWPIIDVARQWDGWAIPSDDPRSAEGMTADHTRYDVVDLYSPLNVVTRNGNTTFVVAP